MIDKSELEYLELLNAPYLLSSLLSAGVSVYELKNFIRLEYIYMLKNAELLETNSGNTLLIYLITLGFGTIFMASVSDHYRKKYGENKEKIKKLVKNIEV